MLRVHIIGTRGAGKTWLALIIKAAVTAAGGTATLVDAEESEFTLMKRYRELANGTLPMSGKTVEIAQQNIAKEG